MSVREDQVLHLNTAFFCIGADGLRRNGKIKDKALFGFIIPYKVGVGTDGIVGKAVKHGCAPFVEFDIYIIRRMERKVKNCGKIWGGLL